mmetsp:Transcript_19412/g.58472  ORF Transcript_19412/g.58472 Transcript_19412/m.58472 type:complete len:286 (-) Transcript_19412:879-1736(-)
MVQRLLRQSARGHLRGRLRGQPLLRQGRLQRHVLRLLRRLQGEEAGGRAPSHHGRDEEGTPQPVAHAAGPRRRLLLRGVRHLHRAQPGQQLGGHAVSRRVPAPAGLRRPRHRPAAVRQGGRPPRDAPRLDPLQHARLGGPGGRHQLGQRPRRHLHLDRHGPLHGRGRARHGRLRQQDQPGHHPRRDRIFALRGHRGHHPRRGHEAWGPAQGRLRAGDLGGLRGLQLGRGHQVLRSSHAGCIAGSGRSAEPGGIGPRPRVRVGLCIQGAAAQWQRRRRRSPSAAAR